MELYHRYRRGYPPAVLDAVVAGFGLSHRDVVVDLGCGTGQLTVPMAARVRAVVGVDPEPDMLAQARRAAGDRGNVSWVLGSAADVPALGWALGTLGAVTIGQALHWMDHARLFGELAPLIRPGGGIAVVANGIPLWLQDTSWSRALRGCLEGWLGHPLVNACGTDSASQRRYRAALTAAGFSVREVGVDYTDGLDVEQVTGGVYSALPVDRLPSAAQRPVLDEEIRRALEPHLPLREDVHVAIMLGRRD